MASVLISPLTNQVVGDMRNDSAEILFQLLLQEAIVNSSVMGRTTNSNKTAYVLFYIHLNNRTDVVLKEGWSLVGGSLLHEAVKIKKRMALSGE